MSYTRFLNMLPQLGAHYLCNGESDVVIAEHSYSKPWGCHPDASRARAKRTLFGERRNASRTGANDEIDVVTATRLPERPIFDSQKLQNLMYECETHSGLVTSKEIGDDWEEQVQKDGWTPRQQALFKKAVEVLESDRLARLTYENNRDEAVMRRLHTNRNATKFRKLLADIAWDTGLCQWLHATFSNCLSRPLLAIYLDVLQAIRTKAPSLVDKMVASIAPNPTAGEALRLLLKRPWDPSIALAVGGRQRKLPGSPFFVVIPAVPASLTLSSTKRSKAWHNHFVTLGKVVPVTVFGDVYHKAAEIKMDECMEKLVGASYRKVRELQGHFNSRPVVLVGWDTGALIACKVACKEDVSAIVCLGYPFEGILLGGKETCLDSLMILTCPVLFVVGSVSKCCNISRLEEVREKMRADTSLTVIEGADDYLRVSWDKKKDEVVTQSMVDKCIQEEVGEFLFQSLSTAPYRDTSEIDPSEERRPVRRRRGRPPSSEVKLPKGSPSTPKRPPTEGPRPKKPRPPPKPKPSPPSSSPTMVSPIQKILGSSSQGSAKAKSPSTLPVAGRVPPMPARISKPAGTFYRYTPTPGQPLTLTKKPMDFAQPQVFVKPLSAATMAAVSSVQRVGNEQAFRFHKVNPDAAEATEKGKGKKGLDVDGKKSLDVDGKKGLDVDRKKSGGDGGAVDSGGDKEGRKDLKREAGGSNGDSNGSKETKDGDGGGKRKGEGLDVGGNKSKVARIEGEDTTEESKEESEEDEGESSDQEEEDV